MNTISTQQTPPNNQIGRPQPRLCHRKLKHACPGKPDRCLKCFFGDSVIPIPFVELCELHRSDDNQSPIPSCQLSLYQNSFHVFHELVTLSRKYGSDVHYCWPSGRKPHCTYSFSQCEAMFAASSSGGLGFCNT